MKRLTALCYRSDARFAGCLLLCEPTLRTHANLAASNFACNEICVVERKLDPALESVRHVTALTGELGAYFPLESFPTSDSSLNALTQTVRTLQAYDPSSYWEDK